ncbi:hypothetical protein ACKVMI_09960 [Paenimyroides ceti]
MRIIPFLAIAGVLSLASCNKTASEPAKETENTATTPVAETPATPSSTDSGQKTAESGVKLNPPHGEPGHRCEIPVGAPLDSQPSTAVPTQQNQTPAQPANGGKGFLSSGNNAAQQGQPQQVPQQQTAQKTAPGFSGKPNPAHGQPGHRCDIQVGQTLP